LKPYVVNNYDSEQIKVKLRRMHFQKRW